MGLGFSLDSSKQITKSKTILDRENDISIEYRENINSKDIYFFAKYYFLKGKLKPFLNSSFGFGKKKQKI